MSETDTHAGFFPGQLVEHRLFGYRGVVVDVDSRCTQPDDWYQAVAKSRPPKDRPWYRVLVHESDHQTYVAERNLQADESACAIAHRDIATYFSAFADGRYVPVKAAN